MVDDSRRGRTRRRVLATIPALAGTTALAGCFWDQTGATDVVVHNTASESRAVSVTITEADATEPHTSRSLEIPRGESVDPVNASKLPTNGRYTVEVVVEGGPTESFEWDDPKVELAPLHVLLDDSENIKFLLQAG